MAALPVTAADYEHVTKPRLIIHLLRSLPDDRAAQLLVSELRLAYWTGRHDGIRVAREEQDLFR